MKENTTKKPCRKFMFAANRPVVGERAFLALEGRDFDVITSPVVRVVSLFGYMLIETRNTVYKNF